MVPVLIIFDRDESKFMNVPEGIMYVQMSLFKGPPGTHLRLPDSWPTHTRVLVPAGHLESFLKCIRITELVYNERVHVSDTLPAANSVARKGVHGLNVLIHIQPDQNP